MNRLITRVTAAIGVVLLLSSSALAAGGGDSVTGLDAGSQIAPTGLPPDRNAPIQNPNLVQSHPQDAATQTGQNPERRIYGRPANGYR